MKKVLLAIFAITLFVFAQPNTAEAARRVSGYYRSSGTYVQPYYRSSPNSYRWDNYSSRGNYNPYTGRTGTVNWWR